MATCQIIDSHGFENILDCGERGCALICTPEGDECWASCCDDSEDDSSEPITFFFAHSSKSAVQPTPSTAMALCCHEVKLKVVAKLLNTIYSSTIRAPQSKESERVSHFTRGTLDEILRGLGLTIHEPHEK